MTSSHVAACRAEHQTAGLPRTRASATHPSSAALCWKAGDKAANAVSCSPVGLLPGGLYIFLVRAAAQGRGVPLTVQDSNGRAAGGSSELGGSPFQM